MHNYTYLLIIVSKRRNSDAAAEFYYGGRAAAKERARSLAEKEHITALSMMLFALQWAKYNVVPYAFRYLAFVCVANALLAKRQWDVHMTRAGALHAFEEPFSKLCINMPELACAIV